MKHIIREHLLYYHTERELTIIAHKNVHRFSQWTLGIRVREKKIEEEIGHVQSVD